MKIDQVLILAAGKGTRMGSIGKELPKVIWPIFEKSILELEVEYAKTLAPDAKIYINVFNYKEKILNHINEKPKSFEGVHILEEAEVLDIGGAVHNLAKEVSYKGNLLILNSDQFLFSNKGFINLGMDKLRTSDSVLFTYTVDSSDGYNALDLTGDTFQGVIPNKDLEKDTSVPTYTGMSLINLEKLSKSEGESKFFETVANPQTNNVKTQAMENLKYWDFGTIDRYQKSMFALLNTKDAMFYNFLVSTNAIKTEKLTARGYASEEGINLSDIKIDLKSNDICLEAKNNNYSSPDGHIIWNNLLEKI